MCNKYNIIIRSENKINGDNNNFQVRVNDFIIPRNDKYKLSLRSLIVCPEKDIVEVDLAAEQLNYFDTDYIEVGLDVGSSHIWDNGSTNKQKYIIPNNKASTIYNYTNMKEPYPRTVIYQTGNQPEYILNSLDLSVINIEILNDSGEYLIDCNDNQIRDVILNFEIELI